MPSPYQLSFHTYSGMQIPLWEGEDKDEARSVAAKRIRASRRAQQLVTIIECGHHWEFHTPEDAFMIGDNDGTMRLKFSVEDEDWDDEDLALDDDEIAEMWETLD